MVPKSQAIVGLEIGHMAVRAVQTDRAANKVENYVEVAISAADFNRSKPKESYQQAIDSAIYQLDLGDPETYRLGVAFSDVNAGVGNGPDMTNWLTQQVEKLDVSFVYVGEPEVSFSPDGVVNDVLALFRLSGVAVSRMELSPVAAARVLPNQTTATLLLGSGVGWQVDLREGRVFSAYASDAVDRKQLLKMVVDGTELTPLTKLRDIDVPPSLLAEHRIPISLLCPAAGVAKGIANREAENLLYGLKIEAASEIQRREARKSTTGQVQAVPESVAIASQTVPTKTTMFQPMTTGEHKQIIAQEAGTTKVSPTTTTKPTVASSLPNPVKPQVSVADTGVVKQPKSVARSLTPVQIGGMVAIVLLLVVLAVLLVR